MQSLLSAQEQRGASQAALRLYLLGSPLVVWHDRVLTISRRSVRALLYRLASDSGPISRGHLHLLFWSDAPEGVARRNLSHLFTHLRRSLPSPLDNHQR